MSYSNVDRSVDQHNTLGRGQEGNIAKHDELSHRGAGAPNPIADKANETLGLGNVRQGPTTTDRDHPHTQNTTLPHMRDFRGLYDERDGTHPGGLTDRSAVTRPHEGLRGEAGLGGGQREHHDRSHHAPLGQGTTHTTTGTHRGLHDDSDRTHIGDTQRDTHPQRFGGDAPRHERGQDFHTDDRRTFPAEDDTKFSSLRHGGAGNVTGHHAGIRDDDNRHRTFPADDGVNVDRAAGTHGRTGDVTQTRADMRDDTGRGTFPEAEGRDVMSTGSVGAGKVMDEGRNETGRQEGSDRHHTLTHPTGRNVDPERATHAGHPVTGHHDADPRHERLQRTDDRVLKGNEQHRLAGQGNEPYYGESDDVKHVAGQHGHPGQHHAPGTGTTHTTTGQTGRVGLGDKIKGAAENMAGKILADPGMQQRGTERKEGLNQTGTASTAHTAHPTHTTGTDKY